MPDALPRNERHRDLPPEAKHSQWFHLALLNAIPSSVLLINRQMRVVLANRNFLLKGRRSLSDTVGQGIEAVFPPAVAERMNLVRRVESAFEGSVPATVERIVYRAPGLGERVYHYRLIPFRLADAVAYVILIMEDVTEQFKLGEEVRRTERYLASIVENASDIMVSTDVGGTILTWNGAAERISGYSAEEARARQFFEVCPAPDQASVRQAFQSARKDKGFAMEWDLVTKAGDLVPVSWVGSVIKKDDQGLVAGIVVVGRDLTERRRLEAQVLQSQKLAALAVLAGGIAHEIRNPLSISSSAAEFLLDDLEDPEFRRRCATKILAGIRQASEIIESLLRFARPEVSHEMRPLDLLAVIREAVALAGAQAAVQQVRVQLELPDEPAAVTGAPGLLQQLFMNLLLNAIAAMPDGGALCASVSQSDEEVRVVITDTGCGIPKSELGKIFDPFYTTKPMGKGTGLGLWICYTIVQRHLGLLEVESVEGSGSTFTVRLPRLETGCPSLTI